jgi:hypothetical protein
VYDLKYVTKVSIVRDRLGVIGFDMTSAPRAFDEGMKLREVMQATCRSQKAAAKEKRKAAIALAFHSSHTFDAWRARLVSCWTTTSRSMPLPKS